MNDKIQVTSKVDVQLDTEWEIEEVSLVGNNIISMLDQLCYLVVFSNCFNMEERI